MAQYRDFTDWSTGTCTWCQTVVESGTWCSDSCQEQFKLSFDPRFIREAVLRRDRGVCAKCGYDTEAAARQLEQARELLRSGKIPCGTTAWGDVEILVLDICTRSGHALRIQNLDDALNVSLHLWEADHIIPVAAGGENGLENLQTLCLPCHRRKSADQSRYGRKAS